MAKLAVKLNKSGWYPQSILMVFNTIGKKIYAYEGKKKTGTPERLEETNR